MNPDRWDEIGRQWETGALTPANGFDKWEAIASAEAARIRSLLPGAESLLEVGSGVGRLSPYLAEQFPTLICMDSSRVMRRVTRKRLAGHANTRVVEPDADFGLVDAALVWALYDEEWTDEQTADHAESLLDIAHVALIQNPSTYLVGYLLEYTVERGDDYLIAHPA
jgi:SAM-dependent methyltransferase